MWDNSQQKILLVVNKANIISETQAIIHDFELIGKYDVIVDLAGKIDNYLYSTGLWEQRKEINRIAIKAATALQNEKELAFHYGSLADTLGRQKQFKDAREGYLKALKIQEDLKSYKSVFFIKYTLLSYDFYLGKFDYCFRENFKLIQQAVAKNMTFEVGSFAKNIGWIYDKFNYPNAKFAFISHILTHRTFETNSIRLFNDIADTFISKNLYQKALIYFEKSILYAKSAGNQELIRVATERKISTLIKLKQFDNALTIISEIENQHEEMRDVEEQRMEIYLYKGFIEYHNNNIDKAISYFEKFNDFGEKNLWLAKANIKKYENETNNEYILQANDYLLLAQKYYTKQKNAVELANIYTQFAIIDFHNKKLSSSIKNLTIATNTKKYYGIIDLSEEELVKQKIIETGTPTDIYIDIEQKYKEEYIDLVHDFLITNLSETIQGHDNKEMVLLPEGRSFYGEGEILAFEPEDFLENFEDFWNGKYDNLTKANEVYLYPFYIDKEPVSINEYLFFCEKAGHEKPKKELNNSDKPITDITYADAEAYAKWCKKELPTQAEWEKATRLVNNAFYENNINNAENATPVLLNKIIKQTTIKSSNPEEILEFLVGEEIYQHLKDNHDILKSWNSLDKFDKQYVYEKSELYSSTEFDKGLPFIDFDLSNEIHEQAVLLQMLKLTAYSFAIGGFQKKSNFLKKVPNITTIKVKPLLDALLNEAIKFYLLSLGDEKIINDWNSEKRNWEMLLKNRLGVQANIKVERPNIYEFINSKRIKKISIIGNKLENIHNSEINDEFSRSDVGFRCVKPIFSNYDLKKYLQTK